MADENIGEMSNGIDWKRVIYRGFLVWVSFAFLHYFFSFIKYTILLNHDLFKKLKE